MDIVGGLTAASTAISIAKDLREIDRSIDEAAFKLKIAELTVALADTKVALSDANLLLNKKEQIIRALREELDTQTNGTSCPMCRVGRLEVVKVDPAGYSSGFEFHQCICVEDRCHYKTERLYDSSIGEYSSNETNRK